MNPKLNLLDHSTLVISPTQLDLVKSCPRKWFYRYMCGRARAGAFAARDGGRAFDDAMNLRYREARHEAVSGALQERMLKAIDDAFAPLELPLDEYRTCTRYREVVLAYNEYYKAEPFTVLGVQVPFAVELGEVQMGIDFWEAYWPMQERLQVWPPVGSKPVRVVLHGILDMLVRRHSDGMVLVVDTKTSNSWSTQRQAEYDNHAQMKSYAWATPRIKAEASRLGLSATMTPEQLTALETLPEVVNGCMVNAVVIRPPYKREGSAERANAKPRNEFHRYTTTYTPERLDEWRADTLLYVKQMLANVASGHWPQNEKFCQWSFGKQCEYWDVCSVPIVQRDMVLNHSDLYEDYKRLQPPSVAATTLEADLNELKAEPERLYEKVVEDRQAPLKVKVTP